MADKRGKPRGGRRWLNVQRIGLLRAVALTLVSLAVAGVVVWTLFTRLLRGDWPWQVGALDESTPGKDNTQIVLTVIAGLGAAVALVVAYRRQRDAELARFDERFAAAAAQLGAGTAVPNDREVRLTIISTITRHLRDPADGGAPTSWQGHDLDFTGATFDGGDFTRANFSGGRVTFDEARFTAGTVSFDGAEFAGGEVDFDGAEFAGGQVDFDGAEFAGGQVTFTWAKFTGGRVTFDRAGFTAGVVTRDGAEFRGWPPPDPGPEPTDRVSSVVPVPSQDQNYGRARHVASNPLVNHPLQRHKSRQVVVAKLAHQHGRGYQDDQPRAHRRNERAKHSGDAGSWHLCEKC
jgi:hypothetical protein